MRVNKLKSLNEYWEKLAREQAELAIKHKWTDMTKLSCADQLIVKTWNAQSVTYKTLTACESCHLDHVYLYIRMRADILTHEEH